MKLLQKLDSTFFETQCIYRRMRTFISRIKHNAWKKLITFIQDFNSFKGFLGLLTIVALVGSFLFCLCALLRPHYVLYVLPLSLYFIFDTHTLHVISQTIESPVKSISQDWTEAGLFKIAQTFRPSFSSFLQKVTKLEMWPQFVTPVVSDA